MCHSMIARGVVCLAVAALALTASSHLQAEKTFRYQFAQGDVFEHRMVQTVDATIEPGGRMTQEYEIVTDWVVESVTSAGVAEVVQKTNRLRMKMNMPDGLSFEYDSDDDADPQGLAAAIAPALRAFVDHDIRVKIDTRGNVSDVRFPDELLQQLPRAEAFGEMFTAEGMERIAEDAIPAFPDEAIGKGTEWSRGYELANPLLGAMKFELVYAYRGEETVENKVLDKFDARTKIEFGQEGEGIGVRLQDQASDGEFYFDNELGYMTRVRINHTMDMEIEAAGQTFDQQIESEVINTVTKK